MNEKLIFNIAIIVIVLFFYSRVLLRYRDGQTSGGEAFFWTLIWGLIILVVLFPQILSNVSNLVGIGRGLDLFVPVALIVMFYLVFRAYIKVETVEQELTQVIRALALKDLEKKDKKKGKK